MSSKRDKHFIVTVEAVRFLKEDKSAARPIIQTFKGILQRHELARSKDPNMRTALRDLEDGAKNSPNANVPTRPATKEETAEYSNSCAVQSLTNAVMGGPFAPYFRDPKENN